MKDCTKTCAAMQFSSRLLTVVQTLHNYRLLCPGANFLREGRVCEECLGRTIAWPGVWHACYRDSHAASAAPTAMLAVHYGLQTWQRKVDVYVALTEFARRKHIDGGIPAERLMVKPNTLQSDPGLKTGLGDYAIFIGRLSEEKGIRLLLNAWSKLSRNIPLLVVGDGPLRDEVRADVARYELVAVSFLGSLPRHETLRLLHRARFLVLPSTCFESFPMVVVEAFACGVPVITSGHGAPAEIVIDREMGLHFEAANSEDFASQVVWAWTHTEELRDMGRAARREYEEKYTCEVNYQRLMEIYGMALAKPISETAMLMAER
jgi:glycosyltransferase involved in cell wall biosynthesis